MSQLLSQIFARALARKLESLLALCSSLLIATLLSAQTWLASQIDALGSIQAARLIALLSPFPFLFAASIFYFRPRLKYDATTGTYINIKTGARACQVCKDQDKKVVWLQDDHSGWWCNIHRRTFRDPAKEMPRQEKKRDGSRRTAY